MDEQQQQKIFVGVGKWFFVASLFIWFITYICKFADEVPLMKDIYSNNKNVKPIIDLFYTRIAPVSSFGSFVFTMWWKWVPTLKLLIEAKVQLAIARATSTSFEIIRPRELLTFNQCFGSAVWILAYNPPLTLLATSQEHRNVVYGNLLNDGFYYKMIVGRAGAERIRQVLMGWKNDHGQIKEKYLNRIKVIKYEHGAAADLHTQIDGWGTLSADLRGLSFFLIKHKDEKQTVLLYLWGEPFADSFIVPEQAIRFTGNQNNMFEHLEVLFNKRWDRLKGCDGPKYPEQPLTEFCASPEQPLHTGHNQGTPN